MSSHLPEGTTHYHKGNDKWKEHCIKVENPNTEDEKVFIWLDLRPEWGHWSDIPVWDKDNKDNYTPIDEIVIGGGDE